MFSKRRIRGREGLELRVEGKKAVRTKKKNYKWRRNRFRCENFVIQDLNVSLHNA